MGYYFEQTASETVDEHVKILGDEELLDFWEESQFMEGFFHEHDIHFDQPAKNYERLIVQELQLRFCQRGHPFTTQPQSQPPCPF